jgi:hypothetical protein
MAEIVHHMQKRQYQRANDSYLRLSIGNAPWPIGVTMVGIHERSAREKISTDQVAHVLNDEVSRKYIQSLKRYVSCVICVNSASLTFNAPQPPDVLADKVSTRRYLAAHGLTSLRCHMRTTLLLLSIVVAWIIAHVNTRDHIEPRPHNQSQCQQPLWRA